MFGPVPNVYAFVQCICDLQFISNYHNDLQLPDPVRPVIIPQADSKEITVTLRLEAGYIERYGVRCTGPGLNVTRSNSSFTGSVVMTFTGTKPNSNYTISATFYSEGRHKTSRHTTTVSSSIASTFILVFFIF